MVIDAEMREGWVRVGELPRVPPLEPLIQHLEHTRPSSAAMEAAWPGGAALPLKEGSDGAIPGSRKHRRQIASWESVYTVA